MNKSPTTSIIVPVYNVENYLNACVDSLIQQTYQDIEIILVNDGSTDKSGKLCDDLAQKHHQIVVLHQANAGVNFARRNGFKASTGQYIAFVDADDIVSNDYLKTHLDLLIQAEADISVGKTHSFYGDTLSQAEREQCRIKSDTTDYTLWTDKKSILSSFMTSLPPHGNMALMCMWSKLFRREVLGRIDWEIANYRHGEDYFINAQTYNNANSVCYINEYCYYYRRKREEKITLNARNNTSPSGQEISNFEYVNSLKKMYEEISKGDGLELSKEIVISQCRLYTYWLEKLINMGELSQELWEQYIILQLVPLIGEFRSKGFANYMRKNLIHGDTLHKALGNKLDIIYQNQEIEQYLQHKLESVREEASKPQSYVDYTNAWVIMDRPDSSTDSGYHFYKWLGQKHPEINLFYVINQDSNDVLNLQKEGFNLVFTNTQQHIELLNRCIVEVYAYYTFNLCKQRTNYDSLKVYIGHGIKLNDSLNPGLSAKDLFVTTFKREYEFFKDIHQDFVTIQTGLPRYRSLLNNNPVDKKDHIVIAPQWRRWLNKKATREDNYFVQWSGLLQSKDLESFSTNHKIVFMMHPELEAKRDLLDIPKYIRVLRYNDLGAKKIQNLMRQTKTLVTDFSSVAVDYAIAGSNIIYFHFDREDYYSNHTAKKGWFDYDKDGLGAVSFSLEKLLKQLAEVNGETFDDVNKYKSRLKLLIADDHKMLRTPSENLYQNISQHLEKDN